MVEYPIVVYQERKWTVYVHVVPKEIRSRPDMDDYYDKYYVGITMRNTTDRWGSDGGGYKYQHFGKIIRKYGWENIRHIIVYEFLTNQMANIVETCLISYLKSFIGDGHGYNFTKGGDGFLGVQKYGPDNPFYGKHHTLEAKQKMKEHHRDTSGENNTFYNKHHSDETKKILSQKQKERYIKNPDSFKHNYIMPEERKKEIGIKHSKAVYVFDINMNFIGEFESVTKASEVLHISRRIASCIVNKYRKYDKDYIIRFKSEINDIKMFQNNYIVRLKEDDTL